MLENIDGVELRACGRGLTDANEKLGWISDKL